VWRKPTRGTASGGPSQSWPAEPVAEPFIPVSRPSIGPREEELVVDALRSGWVSSLGAYVDAFEAEFARYCGVRYAVSVSSGTTGLHLALAALGIGPGDEVIVPDLTFVATANAVVHAGARPILADIEPETLCLDPDSAKSKVTSRTKAIIPVHLYGHPADMDRLRSLADEHGLFLIEDAAEAHGAEYKSKKIGGLGDCAIFSFYGNKVITTGEGGMLTTDNHETYERAKFLHAHAMSESRLYWHPEVGYNYRMTNLQAALGLAQLERIDEFLSKRATIMEWYRHAVTTGPDIRLNCVQAGAKSSYWMICLEVDWFDAARRDAFMRGLRERGIDTRSYFCTLSSMPMYAQQPLPVAHRKAQIGLNLPTYPDLCRSDVERIGREINRLLDEAKSQIADEGLKRTLSEHGGR
jgi:perosamine synthetase